MWQAITTLFRAPLGKSGLMVFKVWHVALALAVIGVGATSTYVFTQLTASNATPQHVIVFISGLNTTMTDCQEATFLDDTQNQLIRLELTQQIGIGDPYTKGCNDLGQNYLHASSSMILYSYNGGTMDPKTGIWHPKDFNTCDADNHTLTKDIQTFDDMLHAYQMLFPKATFTIIGHSLGGLIALQGAYDYERHYQTSINKVITIDAPLEGVVLSEQANNWIQLNTGHCPSLLPVGSVVSHDLTPLGQTSFVSPVCIPGQGAPSLQPPVVLSQCAARALTDNGVGVYTLGNEKDALFCQSHWVITFGTVSEPVCDTQRLLSEPTVFQRMYDVDIPFSSLNPIKKSFDAFAHDHGALLQNNAFEQDLVRYVLAPVVTFHQPTTLFSSSMVSPEGTTLPFFATVHCLWGTANQATAQALFDDGTQAFVGTSTLNPSDNQTLLLKGMVNFPVTDKDASGHLIISAEGNACQYPTAHTRPTASDYVGGENTSIPFTLADGPTSTQIADTPASSQTANPTNAAMLLSHSNNLTVSAGEAFTLYFDYENTGNSPWTDANHYELRCTPSQPKVNCMGAQSQGLDGVQIPPGAQATFYLTLTAPDSPGTYQTSWHMAQNGTPFDQSQNSIQIKVTAASVAYMSFANKLYAVNTITGKPSWHFQVSGDYTTFFGSLLSSHGLIYVDSQNTIYALDMHSGQQRWTFQAVGSLDLPISSLEISDDTIYAFTADGYIEALNASTGQQQWFYQFPLDPTFSSDSGAFFSDATISNGTLFYASSNGHVSAFEAKSGSPLWDIQTANMSNSLTASAGILCISPLTNSDGETIYALQTSDGTELWHDSETLGNDPTPVIKNNTIYIGAIDNIKALNIQSGTLLWQQPISIVDGLAFNNTLLYVTASDGYVHAFDALTGESRWQFNIELLAGNPIISQNILYVDAGFDGALGKAFALNATTGSQIWTYQAKDYGNPGGNTPIIVAVGAGDVFIDDSHFIHALNTTNGKPLWDFDTNGLDLGSTATIVINDI